MATPHRFQSSVICSALVGSALLVSCAAAPPSRNAELSAQVASPQKSSAADQGTAEAPKPVRQFIKNASLSLSIQSVDDGIKRVQDIVRGEQGDVVGLEDPLAESGRDRRIVRMVIQVPQARLDTTLEKLSQLGTVQNRRITAEDVTDRLVDLDARLRNLRKTESTLLGIMDRSGSVGDVLKVAQEISATREQIEQIAAQMKNLQNQVAYSSLTLSLEAETATVPPQQSLESQFSETWKQSTRSVGNVTVGLMKLGIWLLIYSPYLAILGCGLFLLNRRVNRRRSHPIASPPISQDLD